MNESNIEKCLFVTKKNSIHRKERMSNNKRGDASLCRTVHLIQEKCVGRECGEIDEKMDERAVSRGVGVKELLDLGPKIHHLRQPHKKSH